MCSRLLICSEVRGKYGFNYGYIHEPLKEEMSSFVVDLAFMHVHELIKWARQCHSNLSVHEYDARYQKLLTSYRTSGHRN